MVSFEIVSANRNTTFFIVFFLVDMSCYFKFGVNKRPANFPQMIFEKDILY